MAGPASPDTLDYSRMGEPFSMLLGKSASATLDYARAAEPFQGVAAVSATSFTLSGGPVLAGLLVSGTLSVPLTYTLSGGPVLQGLAISGTLNIPSTPGAVVDTNVYFNPYVWYSDGGSPMLSNNINGSSTYARTNSVGAYIKFKANCTGVSLTYDNTVYSVAGDYPVIQYTVDDGPWTAYQLAPADAGVKALATGLAAGVHKFELRIVTANQTANDAWNWTAAPTNSLKVTGFTITGGTGATSAVTLRPKRAFFCGDSITVGYGVNSEFVYATQVAEALNAEYGVLAYAGQGWGTVGNGNVPTFHTVGTTNSQSWRWYASGKSRLIAGLFSPVPDYAFVMLGVNDGAVADATVTAAATDWLAAMITAGVLKTFLVIPAGHQKLAALSAATLGGGQYLIDMDANSPADQALWQGLNGAFNSWRAADGIHLNTRAHAEVAAKLTQAVMNAIQPGGGGGGRRRFQ